ncbi:uncharacterized protein F4807DRAFT_462179 [Annulohypoxylon truncatum]|uniref:uncharacterized protein n=1 Tax=Annulohypoxylon truncatum TaxID=327061 RepID=UPI002008ACF4|nr:uncharacterized protein F4807DRAFT_462179 [Annulohypoxylon truncatum]KAI1208095.1 hypothetical protein F4807DRAFT_462179 [Annulohypoxylon truncatum]
MCFYYPAPKSKKSKKVKKSTPTNSTLSSGSIQDIARMFPMNHPHGVYVPYGSGQRFEEYEPSYMAKAQAQWASHGDTLKETLGTAKQNGSKLDEVKVYVSDGFAEARDSVKHTQNAIRGTHVAINDTYAAVGDAHNTLKEAYDTIQKNHGEYVAKQDGCVAEIRQVRSLLEDEAKKREEARRKRQSMQEAWEYFQWFQQTERDAEPKSSRSSTRTQSSGSSTSSKTDSNTRRRRRTPPEDQYESEKRQHQDRDLKKAFREYMNEFLGDGHPHAGRPERHHENHNHFYTYPPASPAWSGQYPSDPWNGRQNAPPPYPGWEGFYDDNIDDDMGQRRPPPRRAYNAPRGGRARMGPWDYM